ncbi:monosaccharide ABC transporter membrane protein, CUT2 family [Nocardioides exalbidus]|uniref:Autoinducer 2 import system permease protein LsrD n=1 Tax=Nocardioides exalbidus TaxID=402596 RepID=A0A1H4UFJ3_9ACTN|nr:ABC transporter permease [Nocardioides exalbidus]SEC67632.1 monosaccharide ABC transporter membrane protein, CUT2 family [Nocardioides exalbidus]
MSATTTSTAGRALPLTEGSLVQRILRGAVTPGGAVFILAAVLFVAVIVVNPSFGEPPQLIRFIGRTAPIAIAAMGQYYVIVSGEFDLSMGAVIATQVVIAGNYIGDDESRVLPALVLMLVVGAGIGVINGLATTLLKVPSFIVTLGTMLALGGLVRYLTGGAATGNPVDSFRQIGRGGIEDVPVLDILPYPVIILVVVAVASVLLMRSPFGRTLIATGDNPDAAGLAGAHVWWVKTRAFVLSSLSATVAGILLVGYAGVHPSVGSGYEFQAITAVVLGGVVLGGGRGWVLSAAAGAFALELLFSFLNFQEVESTWRNTVQGLIIILAVALAARAWSLGRRPTRTTSDQSAAPSPTPARPGTEPGEN